MVNKGTFHISFFGTGDGITEFQNLLQFLKSGGITTNRLFTVFQSRIESVKREITIRASSAKTEMEKTLKPGNSLIKRAIFAISLEVALSVLWFWDR